MGRNPAQSQHTANNLPPRQPPNAGKPNVNVNNGAGNCNPMPNNQSTTTLQMKQTQQLHINQHGPNSPGIHVSISLFLLRLPPSLSLSHKIDEIKMVISFFAYLHCHHRNFTGIGWTTFAFKW